MLCLDGRYPLQHVASKIWSILQSSETDSLRLFTSILGVMHVSARTSVHATRTYMLRTATNCSSCKTMQCKAMKSRQVPYTIDTSLALNIAPLIRYKAVRDAKDSAVLELLISLLLLSATSPLFIGSVVGGNGYAVSVFNRTHKTEHNVGKLR